MKFALFLGCKIPFYLAHYESSSRAVLKTLGVELVDIEFNCCGYPIRNLDFESFLLSAARNLALAERQNINILTPCKCCFGSLKHADYLLRENDSLKDRINSVLQEEGLRWEGRVEAKHLLSVLFHEVGLKTIKAHIKHPYDGLKIAAHYGCHALRPGKIVQFDNPLEPSIFERLVAVTGAESVDWSMRLDCCGNPLWGKNNPLSLDLMRKKLSNASQAGADFLCAACTYCQIQFDTVQEAELIQEGKREEMPSILYPQLLGLAFGLDGKALGIECNKVDISSVQEYLS